VTRRFSGFSAGLGTEPVPFLARVYSLSEKLVHPSDKLKGVKSTSRMKHLVSIAEQIDTNTPMGRSRV
jgi:hypothetical protein